jgi:hypothetical protein
MSLRRSRAYLRRDTASPGSSLQEGHTIPQVSSLWSYFSKPSPRVSPCLVTQASPSTASVVALIVTKPTWKNIEGLMVTSPRINVDLIANTGGLPRILFEASSAITCGKKLSAGSHAYTFVAMATPRPLYWRLLETTPPTSSLGINDGYVDDPSRLRHL